MYVDAAAKTSCSFLQHGREGKTDQLYGAIEMDGIRREI